MSPLNLLLIAAGIVLVAVVIAYNRWLEARWRSRSRGAAQAPAAPEAHAAERIEPTLSGSALAEPRASDSDTSGRADSESAVSQVRRSVAPPNAPRNAGGDAKGVGSEVVPPDADGPDREIECMVELEPVEPIVAGSLAAGLHARVGKRLRWFGRTQPSGAWERLSSDSRGRYVEIVACMLLADRNGAASGAQLEAFARLVGDLAPQLPAAVVPPDLGREAQRAEALDRLCADLDVQIGVTVQKPDLETIQGTRLRGVAEASGFRLAPAGRFEYVHEDTGAVLYTLQNLHQEPFTADLLRLNAVPGAVLVLDVARVADPPRVFDQMRLAAKRLATTLGAGLVDDNRRPLDDAAFGQVREQVVAAAEALHAAHIEPGSARAQALFGA